VCAARNDVEILRVQRVTQAKDAEADFAQQIRRIAKVPDESHTRTHKQREKIIRRGKKEQQEHRILLVDLRALVIEPLHEPLGVGSGRATLVGR
jgi:hypothetical protein